MVKSSAEMPDFTAYFTFDGKYLPNIILRIFT